jgi:predicted DNA-binding protein
MTRKNDVQTAVRLPSEAIKRLDELTEKFAKEQIGLHVTRASLIRRFVLQGIEGETEAVAPPPLPKKKRK